MATVKITVSKNGPVLVQGDFEVVDPAGHFYGLGGRTSAAFCRCGASASKPFCDGAHNRCGFQHEPAAFELPPRKS